MAKFGGFKLSDQPNSDKILYKNFMCGKTDTISINGMTWVGEKVKKNCERSRITQLKSKTQ